MGDGAFLLLMLLAALLLLWVFLWGPRAKAAREERERLAAEARAQREAQLAKLKAEREELMRAIRLRAPGFILDARREFEREYRARGGDGMFGHEMSPLVCFGYRVGITNGRSESDRRAILGYAFAADFDATLSFLPASYLEEWGAPLSGSRFKRIVQHLHNMADTRVGRRNHEVAVSHWRADMSWFQGEQRPIVEKYRDL